MRLPALLADAMFAATPADVAQLVEQRFRKPQVTGSNPVVGSSLRSQQHGERNVSRRKHGGGESLIQSNIYRGSTAWQALDCGLPSPICLNPRIERWALSVKHLAF